MSKLNEELFQTCVKLEVLLGLKTNFVVLTVIFLWKKFRISRWCLIPR